MNKTGIEYLDYTWNPTHGCTKTSAGCRNCWAERTAIRLAAMGAPGYNPRDPFRVTFHEDRLDEPRNLKKRSRIGVSFMGDLFHPLVAVETVRRVFRIMFYSARHTYFILTKRPERMARVLGMIYTNLTLYEEQHVWYGVSAENQAEADRRIPALLGMPVGNCWVSVEPMLGPVDIRRYLVRRPRREPAPFVREDPRLGWVVCGGESGPGARPLARDWVRGLAGQCARAGVPFMFKQELKKGRKVSGPKLDGRIYMETAV